MTTQAIAARSINPLYLVRGVDKWLIPSDASILSVDSLGLCVRVWYTYAIKVDEGHIMPLHEELEAEFLFLNGACIFEPLTDGSDGNPYRFAGAARVETSHDPYHVFYRPNHVLRPNVSES